MEYISADKAGKVKWVCPRCAVVYTDNSGPGKAAEKVESQAEEHMKTEHRKRRYNASGEIFAAAR